MTKLALVFAGIFLLSCATLSASPIERIDPPNWWLGMNNPEVQLLIYGKNISTYEVTLQNTGVELIAVTRTDNPNYLFATLNIAKSFNAESITLNFWQKGKVQFTSAYPLLTRQPQSAQRKGFSGQDLIYLITPDRFANGDSSNDTIAGMGDELDRKKEFSRHGGDLAGIIKQLDYLQNLGVSQLWLNPVLENKQPKSSYHGYALTDHYRIDPRYGNNALYQQLAHQARQHGIGLIADMVPNHIGNHHWWMKDLPAKDWINFNAKFSPTNHMRETVQDPYALASDKRQFSDGWFVPTMPDLNQRNPLVSNYLIQNAIWWVETAGLSGIRIDTWSYSDKEFLSAWSQRILAQYPQLNMVGEEWSTAPHIIAYWQRGANNADGYRSNLPSLFDFPLQADLVAALTEKESWNSGLIKLYKTLAADHLYPNAAGLTTFVDNHDMSRIMTQVHGNPANYKMALTLLATLRGIPQIFYGTELAMQHPGTESHGAIRADFPGGWQGDTVNGFTGEGLNTQQVEALNYSRTLFNWRKNASAIHNGQTRHLAPKDGIYCFARFNTEQRWLICVNKNDKVIEQPTARLAPLLDGGTTAIEALTERVQRLDTALSLPAHSVSIYRIQKEISVQ